MVTIVVIVQDWISRQQKYSSNGHEILYPLKFHNCLLPKDPKDHETWGIENTEKHFILATWPRSMCVCFVPTSGIMEQCGAT